MCRRAEGREALVALTLIASTGLLHTLAVAVAEQLTVHALLGAFPGTGDGLPVLVHAYTAPVTDATASANSPVVDT